MNYWDLSPRDRANLTRDEVEKFIDYELMQKGVLRVEAPTLEPVPEVTFAKRRYYKATASSIGSYGSDSPIFPTIEQAEAFAALTPLVEVGAYLGDGRHSYVTPTEVTISPVEMMDAETYHAVAAALARQASIIKKNKEERDEFEKAAKAQDEALRDLWEDWERQRDFDYTFSRVIETWKKYLELSKGDAEIAAGFLTKVHGHEQIREAFEWFGLTAPGELVQAIATPEEA